MTHEEQLILQRIKELEEKQKEQDEKIEYIEGVLRMLTDGTI